MATKNKKNELKKAAREIADMMLRPLARFPAAEQERRVQAIRQFCAQRGIPTEVPTAREIAAIRRGEAAFRRGDFCTLDEYFKSVGRSPRRPRKIVS